MKLGVYSPYTQQQVSKYCIFSWFKGLKTKNALKLVPRTLSKTLPVNSSLFSAFSDTKTSTLSDYCQIDD